VKRLESESRKSIARILSRQTNSKQRRSYMTAMKDTMSILSIMEKQNVFMKIEMN
jgi:hypothetical protein